MPFAHGARAVPDAAFWKATKCSNATDPLASLGTDLRLVLVLSTNSDTSEVEDLLRSLGHTRWEVIRQVRSHPDPATYFGTGKLEEAQGRLGDLRDPLISDGRPLVVVNGELRPPQLFNLEDALDAEVWDRTRLVLEVFRTKAEVREARLQVELARLRYELPFVHEALHRQLKGEHPGFMGGGEVEARTYETHLKRRTRTIQQELERIKGERRTRRAGRKKSGFQLAAIAGYTNSGKSSLLNALCDSRALVEDKVFSTLQTTTRRLRKEFLPRRPYNLLFTDTVGFIRNLPPWLIDAFASTLEEISSADVVMVVVDASEPVPVVQEKLATTLGLLDQIGAPPRMVLLLNKCDLLSASDRQRLTEALNPRPGFRKYPHLFTSTKTHENLQRLVSILLASLLPSRKAWIRIDPLQAPHAGFLHWVYDHADVLSDEVEDDHRVLQIRCGSESWGPLLREARRANVETHAEASTGN